MDDYGRRTPNPKVVCLNHPGVCKSGLICDGNETSLYTYTTSPRRLVSVSGPRDTEDVGRVLWWVGPP